MLLFHILATFFLKQPVFNLHFINSNMLETYTSQQLQTMHTCMQVFTFFLFYNFCIALHVNVLHF